MSIVNDWSAKIIANANKLATAEKTGANAILAFITNSVRPYIGMRIQEGAMAWRVDSDESVKAVTNDILDAAECLKLPKKGTADYDVLNNRRARIIRAVTLYRACDVLGALHNEFVDWDASTVEVPLAWFSNEKDGDVLIGAKGKRTRPFSGGKGYTVTFENENGQAAKTVTVSEASVVALSKPKAARTPQQEAAPVAATGNMLDNLKSVSSVFAAADFNVTGEASDTLYDFLIAFRDASESNRAFLLEIAMGGVPAAKGATINGTVEAVA